MKNNFKKITSLMLAFIMLFVLFVPANAVQTTNVNSINIYAESNVSTSAFNTFVSWVKNMPSYLTEHIDNIKIVNDINALYPGDSRVYGFTDKSTIYITATNLTSRKDTLYHEAGHVLDKVYGHSSFAAWINICNAEWQNETISHYEDPDGSFAEAIALYYTGSLSGKPKTKAAITSLINNGYIAKSATYTNINKTLYTNEKAAFMYKNQNSGYVCYIPLYACATAFAKSNDGLWYKVNYEGNVGYVKASEISTTRDSSLPYTISVYINGERSSIICHSGTYKEIFKHIKDLGYGTFTVKNSWNTTVYDYYNITDYSPCYATNLSKAVVKTLSINGKSVPITCTSRTYKEVCSYIESLGYKSYTLKDNWGSVVYSWYGATESGTCSVSNLSTVCTKTFTIKGTTYNIKCTSGTYAEVFNKIKSLGYTNFVVSDEYGTPVYSWYNVTSSGTISATVYY